MAAERQATNEMTARPVPTALRERVTRELEHEILSGILQPGERLDERKLAERLGVSRTPVREAIGRLAEVGLIEVRPRSGTFVAAIRIEGMYELLEALRELEAACVRLASQRMSAGEKARLADLAQQCTAIAESGDQRAYVPVNLAWHDALLAGARNAPLNEAVGLIRRRAMPFRNESFYHETRLPESATEHGRVTDAILRGDGVEAERLIRHHLDFHRPGFAEVIQKMSLIQGSDAARDE